MLHPCPRCERHLLASARACPHCGAPTARVPTLAAALLGLALAGCAGDTDDKGDTDSLPNSLYGGPPIHSEDTGAE